MKILRLAPVGIFFLVFSFDSAWSLTVEQVSSQQLAMSGLQGTLTLSFEMDQPFPRWNARLSGRTLPKINPSVSLDSSRAVTNVNYIFSGEGFDELARALSQQRVVQIGLDSFKYEEVDNVGNLLTIRADHVGTQKEVIDVEVKFKRPLEVGPTAKWIRGSTQPVAKPETPPTQVEPQPQPSPAPVPSRIPGTSFDDL